jgi:putative ABC transport system permease protein
VIDGFTRRLLARELRAGVRRIGAFTLAAALGVAILVALRSLQTDVEVGALAEASEILGGDLRLQSSSPFPESALSTLDSLSAAGVEVTRGASMASVASVPGRDGSRLVQLLGVGPGFPLAGEVRDEPRGSWDRVLAGEGFAVGDPAVLDQLGIQVGDTVAVGGLRLPVLGWAQGLPVEPGIQTLVGAPFFAALSQIQSGGLLGPGTVARHRAYLSAVPGDDVDRLALHLTERLEGTGVRVRTAREEAESLAEAFGYLARFLGLVGLTGLLLGAVGVGSAVRSFIADRVPSIAVLRCLGAKTGSIGAAYLLLAVVLGGGGAVLGAAMGVGLQHLVPSIPGLELPFNLDPELRWGAVWAGVGVGAWVTLLASLGPLLRVRRISPMAALRRGADDAPGSRLESWSLVGALLLTLLVVVSLQVVDLWSGLWISLGLAVALGALAGLAALLAWGLPRLVPGTAPLALRQGVAALNRPGGQSRVTILALGFGTFLLAGVILVEANFRDALTLERERDGDPAILFDIQEDQVPRVQELLRQEGLSIELLPLVPGRIQEIDGQSLDQILASRAQADGWAYRRLYRNTERRSLDPLSEEVVAGEWWNSSPAPDPGGPVEISVEVELAEELGLEVGSRVTWDIQGLPVPSVVTSLRSVEWGTFRPNFFVVFEPGALEGAPATWMGLLSAPDAEVTRRIQGQVAREMPNVSFLDLTTLLDTLEDLTNRTTRIFRVLTAFLLAVGGLVLLAALLNTRLERRRETALLRTLGASSGIVRRGALAELLLLGGVAGTVGVVLALAAGTIFLELGFDGVRVIPWWALGAVAVGMALGAALVGAVVVGKALRVSPMEALRAES